MSVKHLFVIILSAITFTSIYSFTDSTDSGLISDADKIQPAKYIVETYGCAHCHTPKKDD